MIHIREGAKHKSFFLTDIVGSIYVSQQKKDEKDNGAYDCIIDWIVGKRII